MISVNQNSPKPPALDPETVEVWTGSTYPETFAAECRARRKRALGDAAGLENFGVNLVHMAPGAWSSQRHWHSHQDEFVYVLEGEVVLITDAGEQTLGPGMAAGFPAGSGDGHHLVNRSDADAVYLEVGDRTAGDEVDYPDIDMAARWFGGVRKFVRKNGTPY